MSAAAPPQTRSPETPGYRARSLTSRLGAHTLRWLRTSREILAFALITLGALVTHRTLGSRVVRPMIRAEIHRSGWRLLPMASWVAFGLGLIVLGQTISLLTRVGAQAYIGTIMVTVIVRELGPLTVALLVLARAGTAHVIELGTARALGELEALEALGIDPVHYLVVPRVLGLALSVFALTVYFLLITLGGGFVFAFLQNVALTPAEYVRQIALALRWEDFMALGVKSSGFGGLIAAITCYHGLAHPVRLEELPAITTRAVVQSVIACLLLDLGMISLQLLLAPN